MLSTLIEHGRILQYIVCGGGIGLCTIGLVMGKATFTEIAVMFGLILAAAAGLKEKDKNE